jgi:hypothetical protein
MQADKVRHNDRTIGLVQGYDFASAPSEALGAGLPHRFAVIFDAHRAAHSGTYFDAELYLAVIGEVAAVLGATNLAITWTGHAAPVFRSLGQQLAELASRFATSAHDATPPESLSFASGQDVVAIGNTEFWLLGGRYPYADSYTVAFFTAVDKSAAMLSGCTKICDKLGAEVRCQITGSPTSPPPPKRGLIQTIQRLLGWTV